MKKKIKKIILSVMSVLIVLCACTGCNDSQTGSSVSGIDSSDFDSVFNHVLKSHVLVDSGTLSGCGNIWKIGKKNITVITASHVIEDKEDISVFFWTGDKVKAKVFTDNKKLDYCLLTVTPDDTKSLDITAVTPAKSLPKTGDDIFMVIPYFHTASAGIVAGPEVYSEDFGQNLIHCYVDVNEGMSGGGLFDNSGNYLGILLGGSEEGDGVFQSCTNIK